MPRKTGIVFIAAGAVLILSALSLFAYNKIESANAGREAESLLGAVQTLINEKISAASPSPSASAGAESSAASEPTPTLPPDMPVAEIDGYGYVGYLSIPDLELELPVMSEWDYTRLRLAPCRQFGSSRTDDLVIAAHNYDRHFGLLSKLETGAEIIFTDMDGIVNRYEVALIDTLAPDRVDDVQNSGYDLVLYTCTYGGASRVTVFCSRTEDASPSPALT